MSHERSLAGRTALVTGSTSGIGLAIATELAAQGAAVTLNGIATPEHARKLQDDLSRHGVPIVYDAADLREPAAIAAMIERAGPIDILVNNAGIQHVAPLEAFPEDRWNAIIAVNLSAVFHASKAVLPAMKQRGYGRIINIASAHGLVASPFKSAYVAAKHGVVGLTKVTALEAAEHGITCNAICPGYVWTPLVEQQVTDQAKAHGITEHEVTERIFLAGQPTKRFVQVSEIAAMVVYLCSPAAASVTGAALAIDGGWTAR